MDAIQRKRTHRLLRRGALIAVSMIAVLLTLMGGIANGAEYYVSNAGNNANPGTLSQPWRNVQYAADRASAGDTVYVRAGAYNERLFLTKSGNANSGFITIRNYPGEKPILDGSGLPNGDMVSGIHLKYVRFQGFNVTNYIGAGVVFCGESDHIEIIENEISHNTYQHANAHGILITALGWPEMYMAANIKIDRNYLHDLTTGSDDGYSEALTVAYGVKYFQITNNIVERTSYIGIDMIGQSRALLDWRIPNNLPVPEQTWPQYGYVANNIVRNSGKFSHDTGIYIDGAKDVVIERNKTYNISGYGIVTGAEDPDFITERILVRFNESSNNTRNYAPGGSGGNMDSIYLVHNIAYSSIPGRTNIALFKGTNVQVKNNISINLAKNYHLTHYYGTTYAPTLNNNLYYPGDSYFQYKGDIYLNFQGYQAATKQDVKGKAQDPQLANDFSPLSTSPALDAGAALTKTASAGSGRIVKVEDARYFFDGYTLEGVSGDIVQVGPYTAKILSINLAENSFTVDRDISWNAGQDVSYPFKGIRPDIGPKEFSPYGLNLRIATK